MTAECCGCSANSNLWFNLSHPSDISVSITVVCIEYCGGRDYFLAGIASNLATISMVCFLHWQLSLNKTKHSLLMDQKTGVVAEVNQI